MTNTNDEHSDKSPRPLALTIIGWWLIVTGVMCFYGLIAVLEPAVQSTWLALDVNPAISITFIIVSGVAHTVAGIGILKGFRWARTLYLVFGVLSLIFSSSISELSVPYVLIGVISYVLIAFILTRKTANDYFAGVYKIQPVDKEQERALTHIRKSQRSQNGFRQVFGVLFSIGGGFFLFTGLFAILYSPGEMLVIVMAIFSVPGLIALAIGILLWGRARWAEMGGWTLAVAGGLTLLMNIYMAIMMQTELWQTTMVQMETEIHISAGSFIAVSLLSALVAAAGAGLVYKQRMWDKEKAQHYLESVSGS